MEKGIVKENEYLIPVNVSEGMFSSEYTIELKLADGKKVSFFADKFLISEQKQKHFLKVTLIDKKENTALVLLPVETFETASRWVEVPKAA